MGSGLAQAHLDLDLDLGDADVAYEHAERAARLADEWSFALIGGQAQAVLAAIHLAVAEFAAAGVLFTEIGMPAPTTGP